MNTYLYTHTHPDANSEARGLRDADSFFGGGGFWDVEIRFW